MQATSTLHTVSFYIQRENVLSSRQRTYSSETSVVPKAVKSGVVTKRSSLHVSTEKQLEVKVNVTGKWVLYYSSLEDLNGI